MGAHSSLGRGPVITSSDGVQIGHHVSVGRNCTIDVAGPIDSYALIAQNVGIVGRDDHDFRTVGVPVRYSTWVGDRSAKPTAEVDIGSDARIGYGAVILPD